ncbi:DUF2254 domain-containing protein [Sphingomonas sabuli]|nr:DUF2254 domain-containing protein [Sphingomonas sabuli]
MRLPILQFWRAVRWSYWFVPSLMAIGAILLGATAIWLDTTPAGELFEKLSWYQKSKPEGARSVLSAIAGSMITVAGVVFSITIVAISYAATQYGPRILTNFMSDRGNQVTLGTFIATFLYSLMVLRTIYDGDTIFVPQLAVFLAMVFAACSIAVLIYFVHHVPESIHVNHVAARIGRRLVRAMGKTFPAGSDHLPDDDDKPLPDFDSEIERFLGRGDDVAAVRAQESGYIQAMDIDELVETACRHDLVVCLLRTPGDFVYSGRPYALAAPADRVSEDADRALRHCYSVGNLRTPFQDLHFLIDELVDIAARAMSSGVNDPFTARTCIDWLAAGAAEMAGREAASRYRLDAEGVLRVIMPEVTFGDVMQRGFGAVRSYVAHDLIAADHTIVMLASLSGRCRTGDQLQCVRYQVDGLMELAKDKLAAEEFARLDANARDCRRAIGRALDRRADAAA